MDVNSIRDAFDRVAKKQKLSYSKTQEVIDQITQEISDSIEKIRNAHNSDSHADYKTLLADLKTKIKEMVPLTLLEGTQKELNVALSKYPKLLEKSFNPDISKAYRNVDLDTTTINYVIASHFYQQGLFDVGDCFVAEAMEPESITSMRSPYVEMYQILEAMKSRNLEPALKWATSNCSKLKANGSDLEVKLHQMQFVEILRRGDKEEALKYARIHSASFVSDHMVELGRLMCCLVFAGKLEQSPYHDLLSPANWDKLAEELTRQFCCILGQSFESPLGVTIAAGVQALPQLLKFMNVMWGKKQEWQSMKQLPVPVELDDAFQFHSIFVCPVSKEQATDDNPPMLMPCGHVLCKQSIVKMSKNLSKSFKCPYCPTDIDSGLCKPLYF
ncbi:uncharacterized protein J3R85_021177 [Psidium guajava]|nr:uncharacterized protein J3R85_021177 [Psidium guajava]